MESKLFNYAPNVFENHFLYTRVGRHSYSALCVRIDIGISPPWLHRHSSRRDPLRCLNQSLLPPSHDPRMVKVFTFAASTCSFSAVSRALMPSSTPLLANYPTTIPGPPPQTPSLVPPPPSYQITKTTTVPSSRPRSQSPTLDTFIPDPTPS